MEVAAVALDEPTERFDDRPAVARVHGALPAGEARGRRGPEGAGKGTTARWALRNGAAARFRTGERRSGTVAPR